MTETAIEKRTASEDQWRQFIVEQERSGATVKGFCQEHGVREHSFYYWRKRFRERQQPMRFALVERGPARSEVSSQATLELLLTTGERLRIGAGIDATTLRTVLAALRG